VLSPHSPATLAADRSVQVENEPGLLGSARDFSPDATRQFNGPVPRSLLTALHKGAGSWKEVFGARRADEAFSAYAVATYTNEVARAGKEVYPLPTYLNVWQGW
jgi:hypothetical protein